MACKPGSVPLRAMAIHLERLLPDASRDTPGPRFRKLNTNGSLLGLAPGGVYRAAFVAKDAVRSYRTLSPLPDASGGLLSVALSLRSLSPGVTRHRVSVEPGLSSLPKKRGHPAI